MSLPIMLISLHDQLQQKRNTIVNYIAKANAFFLKLFSILKDNNSTWTVPLLIKIEKYHQFFIIIEKDDWMHEPN